jgi:bifunctional enzyme CysN/CysC
MIRGEVRTATSMFQAERKKRLRSPDVVWESWNIPRERREGKAGHRAAIIWLTGLSGSGKSTVARALERRLFDDGIRTMLLDGDQVRHGLCADLGFSADDREENIRRVAHVARLFFEAGHVVVCTFVSPFRKERELAKSLVPAGRFIEVYIDTPLEVCRGRDPKGLYAKADAGEIRNMTGVSSPYEAPENPDVEIRTVETTPEDAVERLVATLRDHGLLA